MPITSDTQNLPTSSKYLDLGFAVFRDDSKQVAEICRRALDRATQLGNAPPSELEQKWRHKSGQVKHIVNPHRTEPIFRELIQSGFVQNVIAQTYGPSPVYVTHSKISYKVAHLEQVWLPHQDSAYKGHDAQGLTVCIFLEDCDRENGTIEVFPRSHLQGRMDHQIIFVANETEPQIKLRLRLKQESEPVCGLQGDVLCMSLHTVHQSGHNRRDGLRSIFIFEVEPIYGFPLEYDGRNALVLNCRPENLTRSLFLPLVRRWLYFKETQLKPLAKRALYLLHLVFNKSNTKRTDPNAP